MRKLLLSLLILLARCSQISEPVVPPQPEPQVQLYILPVLVVEQDGDHLWDMADWRLQVQYAQQVWASLGIQLLIREPVPLVQEDWTITDTPDEFLAMSLLAQEHYEQNRALTVWMVKWISIGPVTSGGLGRFPWMQPPNCYGIWINCLAPTETLAHELGHAMGLRHTWQDWHSDTPSLGEHDCESDPCNIMGYCDPCWDLATYYFSPQQEQEVHSWLDYPTRKLAVTPLGIP